MGDFPSSSRVVPIPPVRISLVDPIPKLSPFTSLPFNGRSPLLVSSPLVQITSRLPFPMSSKSPPASCLPITSRLPSFSSLANHLPPYVIKSHRTCGSNGRLRLRVDPSCLARRHCPPVLLLMGRSAGSTLVGGPSVLRVDARLEAGVPASRTLVLATLHSPRLLSSNHLPPPVPLSRVSRHCPPVSRRAAGDRCRRRSSAWEGGREATRRVEAMGAKRRFSSSISSSSCQDPVRRRRVEGGSHLAVSRRTAGDRCRRRSSAWEGGREATRRGRFRFGR